MPCAPTSYNLQSGDYTTTCGGQGHGFGVQDLSGIIGQLEGRVSVVKCAKDGPVVQQFTQDQVNALPDPVPSNPPIHEYIASWTFTITYCWNTATGEITSGNFTASGQVYAPGWSYDGYTGDPAYDGMDYYCYFVHKTAHFSFLGLPDRWTPDSGWRAECPGI